MCASLQQKGAPTEADALWLSFLALPRRSAPLARVVVGSIGPPDCGAEMRSIGLFALATLALAIYLVSPYFALYRIDQAISDRDTLRLERYADWTAIREQLRADLKGLALDTVTKQTANND